MHSSIVSILSAAALLCAGCMEGPGFPAMSLAKFVRAPSGDDDAGAVGFSTGLMIIEDVDLSPDPEPSDDFQSNFYFFPAEGSLSFWLAENYDLSLSVNMRSLMYLEGNLGVDLGGVRIGFLHGVGAGLMGEATGYDDSEPGYEDNWIGALPYAFTAGLLIQTTLWKSGALFLGARYTYSAVEELGGSDDYPDTEMWTHFVNGSIGFTFTAGALRITPEFILCYGHHYKDPPGPPPDGDQTSDEAWIILPTINIAAAF